MSSERDDSRADANVGGHAGDTSGETAEEHGPDHPARRSRLAVAAVAAAVLLAGGGGAYWAASANGGGGSSRAAPAPLRLDGRYHQPATGSSMPTADGGSTYQLTGTLPKGPGSAAVYRSAGTVGADDVKRLAALLDVGGALTSESGAWRMSSVSGSSAGQPELLVSKDAPGTWTYSRYGAPTVAVQSDAQPGGTSDVRSGAQTGAGADVGGTHAADGSGTPSPGSGPSAVEVRGADSPVPEEKARAVAAPVLDGLGLSGARIDAAGTAGALRTVTADPVVDGLPTHGWATSLQIGPDGRLAMGSGRLVPLEKGDTYPVVTAQEALKQLNTLSPVMHPDHGIASCVMPMPKQSDGTPATTLPGEDRSLPRTLPCVPGNGHPVQVRGAVFGLAMEFVSSRQTLVPAWLFDTAPAGVSRTTVVAQPAVDPAYVLPDQPPAGSPPAVTTPEPPNTTPGPPGGSMSAGPGQPADPRAPHRATVFAYRASGTTLTLSFWGGVCDRYQAKAEESGSQVRVFVTGTPLKPGGICPALAKRIDTSVQLMEPLGDRSVVDATSGRPVQGQ